MGAFKEGSRLRGRLRTVDRLSRKCPAVAEALSLDWNLSGEAAKESPSCSEMVLGSCSPRLGTWGRETESSSPARAVVNPASETSYPKGTIPLPLLWPECIKAVGQLCLLREALLALIFPSTAGWPKVSRENEVEESQKGAEGSRHKSHQSKQVWEDTGEEAFAEKEVQSFDQHARLGIFTIEMILFDGVRGGGERRTCPGCWERTRLQC